MSSIPGIGYWTAKAALLHPRRTALVTPEGRTTYAELDERVRRAAALLVRLGVRAGSRFGILMLNDRRFVELLFAAGRVGAIAVPLNWRLAAPELEYVVRDAGIELLFVGPEQRELGAELEARCGCRVVSAPESYDALLVEVEEGALTGGSLPGELPGDDDPVLMVYTSGTTGRPKGAVLTHANLFWNAINDILALGLTYRDVTLTVLPLMHVGGIGLFTLPMLLCGGTVTLPRSFDAEQTLRLIAEHRVSVFIGVPTIHKLLVESPEFATADLASLRFAYNGGDRCPLALVEAYQAKGVPFGGGYGLTETAPTAFLTELDQLEEGTRAIGFAGKPAFFTDARIVDASGTDAAPGEVGEVLIQGSNLFLEYWGLPEQTAEAMRDGWFHTGDLARRDADGFTFIAGRKKEMIKSGGENIYPAEVEQVLLQHPQVAEACVIGRPHPKWNEVPFAVVALRPGGDAGEEELRGFCRERLARFKVPAGFAFVAAIPRTSIGKPDRPALIERYGREAVEVAG
ncbi:MAG TPA: long-chain fatty acid--CoA ligase [Longimicrobiaceae bacterium]|nr:long-chain fatty acid--CoA ligase [Longimicrobiaceae bacterium]